jgi:hypothetical protein
MNPQRERRAREQRTSALLLIKEAQDSLTKLLELVDDRNAVSIALDRLNEAITYINEEPDTGE